MKTINVNFRGFYEKEGGAKGTVREGLMAVDFCLHTNTAFDDLSLSAARRDAHRTSIGEIIRRGAKVIQIGGIGNMTFAQIIVRSSTYIFVSV